MSERKEISHLVRQYRKDPRRLLTTVQGNQNTFWKKLLRRMKMKLGLL